MLETAMGILEARKPLCTKGRPGSREEVTTLSWWEKATGDSRNECEVAPETWPQ